MQTPWLALVLGTQLPLMVKLPGSSALIMYVFDEMMVMLMPGPRPQSLLSVPEGHWT
jgi:hypothetical protein